MKIKIETAALILTAALITPTGYLLAGPSPAIAEARSAIPDERITQHVHDALALAPELQHAQVTISTSAGAVKLSGWTRSESDMATLEELASRVEGVREVRSHLRIRAESTSRRLD